MPHGCRYAIVRIARGCRPALSTDQQRIRYYGWVRSTLLALAPIVETMLQSKQLVSFVITAALASIALSACGGPSTVPALKPTAAPKLLHQSAITSFGYTGSAQTYVAPYSELGLTFVRVTAYGASGGAAPYDPYGGGGTSPGGLGAQVVVELALLPFQKLVVSVGGAGSGMNGYNGGSGGYNGGGAGGYGVFFPGSGAGGGGGATTVTDNDSGKLLVAAGGGGGAATSGQGGNGGQPIGDGGAGTGGCCNVSTGGAGGSGAGGAAGAPNGASGILLFGGAGVNGTSEGTGTLGAGGGGGGGGYYGGGGGANDTYTLTGGAGGGGSSYVFGTGLLRYGLAGGPGNGSASIEAL